MKNLPENGPVRFFTTMFQHVQCQTLLLPVRQVIYSIFDILLGCKSSNLKSLGPDVVYGFINSIDGESDPRNLLILFRIIPHFVKEFSLGHLTEEMFEIIACYFPVHYNTVIIIIFILYYISFIFYIIKLICLYFLLAKVRRMWNHSRRFGRSVDSVFVCNS